jgi:hypothetical protein
VIEFPIGTFVFKWNDGSGPILLLTNPENLSVDHEILKQVHNQAMVSLDPGIKVIESKNNKIIAFFSGRKEKFVIIENHFVALWLRRDENPEKYQPMLETFAYKILKKYRS